jgi:HEAT repeat protein
MVRSFTMLWWNVLQLISSDPYTRGQAASRLGRARSLWIMRLLVKVVTSRVEEQNVHWAAGKALGEIGNVRAIEPLVKALKDPLEAVRRAAAKALGEIGEAQAVVPLIELLKDSQEFVRREVAKALDALAYQPVNDAQRALLAVARSEWTRASSLGAVAFTPVIEVLEDSSASVRCGAVKALGELGEA